MRLTTHTDYALRTLIYLALAPARRGTIAAIAQAYGISENHLMKVVHQLGRAGHVETLRGRGGGLRLARAPQAINLGTVVRDAETDRALVPCFETAGACRIAGDCRLAGILGEALDAFLGVLDRYSLADLTAPGPGLAALLGLDATAPVTAGSKNAPGPA